MKHTFSMLCRLLRMSLSQAGKGRVFLFLLCAASLSLPAQINTENIVQMGRTALYFDDYVTAIRLFNQAIAARPRNPQPYHYRAYAKFTLEDYTGAEADCSKAIELNPYIPEVYQLRGLCRIHNNNYQGAAEDYTRTLAEMPNDQASLYNRALCRLELKEYDTASADLDMLLRKWPKLYKVYLLKAQVAMEQEDTARAITLVDTLLSLNPKEEAAWSFKGRYALGKDEYALADSCLTKAIALQPDNHENYLARAIARNGLNRLGNALEDYDKVIELVPQHFVAHYNRGLLRAQVGDDNRAIEDFNFVIRQEPDNVLAIYNRALLREQTGDFRGAVTDYTTIIKNYPNFIAGYVARARCRRKIGDTRGAARDEARVYRADLDLMFGTGQRKPVKKVRKRSDHSLDNYQQLVEEDADTTHIYIGELFGKVQNRQVEKKLLPPFMLTVDLSPSRERGAAETYLPEVEKLNKLKNMPGRIRYTADNTATTGTDLSPLASAIAAIDTRIRQKASCEDLLARSAIHATMYNYEAALADARNAAEADSTSYLALSQYAALLWLTPANTDENKLAPAGHTSARLALALAEANRAIAANPHRAMGYYNRGCIHFQDNDRQAAIADFGKAIELDPKLAEAYYNRAVIYLIEGNNEKAIPDLSMAGEAGLYKAYSLLKQARKQ